VKKVHLVEVGSVEVEAQRLALPEHVRLVMIEIAESAKEGLLALAVGAGLTVLHECMEHEVDEVVGPRGRDDRGRTTKRHGHVGGEVTLGGSDSYAAAVNTSGRVVGSSSTPWDAGIHAVRWQIVTVPGPPATLTLAPKTATNTVDAQHCVTATVKDQFGNVTPNITVRFAVTGAVTTSGSVTTNASGEATFCYTSALPGSDVITAYADTNNNGVQDPGEPGDTAAKTWVLPPSTPGCKVTYGGRILAANGAKATFGGNAMVPASGPKGSEEYRDHGAAANLNVHSINVLAVTCSADGKSASIFGTATINGSGSFSYRIDLTDNGEPGAGSDTYRIRLSSGYDSGTQTLSGGNVQLH
jgi:hypothetical protein